MRRNNPYIILVVLAIISSPGGPVFGQSGGGTFTLTNSAIANGGGGTSGGTLNVTGTNGQSAAGTNMSGGQFTLTGGFFHPGLAPTAANASISGRVMTPEGNGVNNAVVILVSQQGVARMVFTSSFGYYRFDAIEAGETVVISVSSKSYEFNPQFISVTDDLTKVNFTALYRKQ